VYDHAVAALPPPVYDHAVAAPPPPVYDHAVAAPPPFVYDHAVAALPPPVYDHDSVQPIEYDHADYELPVAHDQFVIDESFILEEKEYIHLMQI
jgi:hypothetical protein